VVLVVLSGARSACARCPRSPGFQVPMIEDIVTVSKREPRRVAVLDDCAVAHAAAPRPMLDVSLSGCWVSTASTRQANRQISIRAVQIKGVSAAHRRAELSGVAPIQRRICLRRHATDLFRRRSAPRPEDPKPPAPAAGPTHRGASAHPVPPLVRVSLRERRTSAHSLSL